MRRTFQCTSIQCMLVKYPRIAWFYSMKQSWNWCLRSHLYFPQPALQWPTRPFQPGSQVCQALWQHQGPCERAVIHSRCRCRYSGISRYLFAALWASKTSVETVATWSQMQISSSVRAGSCGAWLWGWASLDTSEIMRDIERFMYVQIIFTFFGYHDSWLVLLVSIFLGRWPGTSRWRLKQSFPLSFGLVSLELQIPPKHVAFQPKYESSIGSWDLAMDSPECANRPQGCPNRLTFVHDEGASRGFRGLNLDRCLCVHSGA